MHCSLGGGEHATDCKSQQSYRNAPAVKALQDLFTDAGFDVSELLLALEAIKTAKEQSPKKEDGGYSSSWT